MTRKNSKNVDYLISIVLVVKPNSPSGLSGQIKYRIAEWEKEGLIKHIPISASLPQSRVEKFIKDYSSDEDE